MRVITVGRWFRAAALGATVIPLVNLPVAAQGPELEGWQLEESYCEIVQAGDFERNGVKTPTDLRRP